MTSLCNNSNYKYYQDRLAQILYCPVIFLEQLTEFPVRISHNLETAVVIVSMSPFSRAVLLCLTTETSRFAMLA